MKILIIRKNRFWITGNKSASGYYYIEDLGLKSEQLTKVFYLSSQSFLDQKKISEVFSRFVCMKINIGSTNQVCSLPELVTRKPYPLRIIVPGDYFQEFIETLGELGKLGYKRIVKIYNDSYIGL